MEGFDAQDKGLFTFYRQQAEMEEQIKQQKREKARLKKLRQQTQKRKKQEEQEKKKLMKAKSENPSVSLSKKVNYIERAKNYIKDVQIMGKLMQENAKSSKNKPLSQGKAKNLASLNSQIQGTDIFINKKDYYLKFNYLNLQERQSIEPKQFDSVGVFDLQKMQMKRSSSEVKGQIKLSKHNIVKSRQTEKLPRISDFAQSQSQQIVFKRKKSSVPQYYNPKDILLNNKKFNISQQPMIRSPRELVAIESGSLMDIIKRKKFIM